MCCESRSGAGRRRRRAVRRDRAPHRPIPNLQVVDKALLDAVACGADAPTRVPALVREVHRVLKPGGCLLLVTHAALQQRAAYLAASPWASVASHNAGGGPGAVCTLLVARKMGDL